MTENTDKEIELTKGISNATICQYFYIVFILISIYVAIVLLWEVYIIYRNPRLGIRTLLTTLPMFAIAVTNFLFFYVMCARSLLK